MAGAPHPLAAAEGKRTRKCWCIVNSTVRVSTPKFIPSVSPLNSTVRDSVHHTQVWHSFKKKCRKQENSAGTLCLFCESACDNCCIFTVGNKCRRFCLIATGKMITSDFMHWPSQMKHARFGSPCSCYSQDVVGVQTLAGILIQREKDDLRCYRPLCHSEDEQRVGRIMSWLFCFQLVWFGFVGFPLPCVTPWSV